jgi:segregation and condensation protein A
MNDVAEKAPPFAFLHGQAVIEKPEDLYIPPDALEIILETFEGPLDLLLYLIKRHKLDILELPILSITQQYVAYVELMTELRLELAGEYLVMAALLAQIKSRMLLPIHEELEQYKLAAENLDQLPRLERDILVARALVDESEVPVAETPEIALKELMLALADVMARAKTFEHHQITTESLSTRERMSQILHYLSENDGQCPFTKLFKVEEGRSGVVVTFIAMLELIKEQLINCLQVTPSSQIYLSLQLQE